jgi:hypothetical protein
MRLGSLGWFAFLALPLCAGAMGWIGVILARWTHKWDTPDEMRLRDRARAFARELRRLGEANEPAE